MASAEDLVTCARLCVLSYCDDADIKSCFQQIPDSTAEGETMRALLKNAPICPTACTDSDNDSVAYVVTLECPTKLYVVFRGTDDLEDILQDADVFLEPLHDPKLPGEVQVHSGFQHVYGCLKAAVHPIVDKHMLGADATVSFVGFSLGAAVAAIAALSCAQKHPGRVSLLSLGMPRTGNKAWADAFNTAVPNSVRVINGSDPISKVPFGNGYTHIGQELHVGHSDMFPSVPVLTALIDHKLSAYQTSIENHIRNTPSPSIFDRLAALIHSLFFWEW